MALCFDAEMQQGTFRKICGPIVRGFDIHTALAHRAPAADGGVHREGGAV